ncbi:DUF4352 domain-containing protein [Edaphobacter sp. HDX4]|uniref:DUF4352 domain-containing protein n=1 Tax=Edaphobacter sp. HDX4 TaxID=2794064 RepID=UPI002FE5CEDC
MKNILAVVGFVACLGFGIVVFGMMSNASSSDSSAGSTEATETKADSPYTVEVADKRYTGKTVSNVGAAILGFGDAPFLSTGYSMERPDGKFIVVKVAVTNYQRDAITMDNNLFKLLSPDGVEYSSSSKSMSVPAGMNLFLASLNPGITKVGIIVFDVPPTLDLRNLTLQFRGGMTGSEASMPLRVVASDMEPVKSEPVPEPVQSQPQTGSQAEQVGDPPTTPNAPAGTEGISPQQRVETDQQPQQPPADPAQPQN